MPISPELAALIGRLSAGEDLSPDEISRLNSLVSSRKRGRPPRDDLKRFRDEFGRAAAFFIARSQGKGDADAIADAAADALSSPRRIREGVTWLCELTGVDSAVFIDALRWGAARARRISTEGIEALTKSEILLTAGDTFIEYLEEMLPPAARATILVRHLDAFNAAHSAVIDRAIVVIRELAAVGTVTEQTSNLELLMWVDATARIEAEAQVQKLAELLP